MPLTVYGNSENGKTQRVLAAAKYGGTEVTLHQQAPPADKFSFGVCPALEDGATHIEGAAGCQWYVGGDALKGQTQEMQPQVIQWLDMADHLFNPNVLSVILPAMSLAPLDKKAHDAAHTEMGHLLQSLDHNLLTRTFLVGERMSHADIALAMTLLPAFQHGLDAEHRAAYPNVTRWFLTVMNQPEVKSVVPTLTLCETAAQFDAQKWKENQSKVEGEASSHGRHGHGHHGHGHGNRHGNRQKKKSERSEGGDCAPPKKEEKKKEASPATEEMDETEQAMAAEPKQSDPLAAMPKGTFNMDEFKRVYSNEDTVEKAIPYFWEKFDPEHYSIWYCEYKFPKELALVFMSCNLIGGMYQRLEKLKKNAFASVALFGKDHDSTIAGIWIWRGQELAFPLSPDWQIDYESYTWTKMDAKSDETKKLVNAYWAWEGFAPDHQSGRPFNQGKIFK